MKSILPSAISSIQEAKIVLAELHKNNEIFHPEDNAIEFFGEEDGSKLNKLMDDIYGGLNGGDHRCPVFCPCEFGLKLIDMEGLKFPSRDGQLVRFISPNPDENPETVYLVKELHSIDPNYPLRPTVSIQAIGTNLTFPPINLVHLNELMVVCETPEEVKLHSKDLKIGSVVESASYIDNKIVWTEHTVTKVSDKSFWYKGMGYSSLRRATIENYPSLYRIKSI